MRGWRTSLLSVRSLSPWLFHETEYAHGSMARLCCPFAHYHPDCFTGQNMRTAAWHVFAVRSLIITLIVSRDRICARQHGKWQFITGDVIARPCVTSSSAISTICLLIQILICFSNTFCIGLNDKFIPILFAGKEMASLGNRTFGIGVIYCFYSWIFSVFCRLPLLFHFFFFFSWVIFFLFSFSFLLLFFFVSLLVSRPLPSPLPPPKVVTIIMIHSFLMRRIRLSCWAQSS